MGFFVTSRGIGNGAHLGGLAGADRHCQELAEAVGAGDRTWRAYLSTSFQETPAINAGDRIGAGPWFNAKGMLIARGVTELHKKNRLSRESALTEKGERLEPVDGHIDIFTGTLPDGSAAVGMNCNNWASNKEGTALLGHLQESWNSAHPTNSCSVEARFYCFAADSTRKSSLKPN
jgi:hypothetical protein